MGPGFHSSFGTMWPLFMFVCGAFLVSCFRSVPHHHALFGSSTVNQMQTDESRFQSARTTLQRRRGGICIEMLHAFSSVLNFRSVHVRECDHVLFTPLSLGQGVFSRRVCSVDHRYRKGMSSSIAQMAQTGSYKVLEADMVRPLLVVTIAETHPSSEFRTG